MRDRFDLSKSKSCDPNCSTQRSTDYVEDEKCDKSIKTKKY